MKRKNVLARCLVAVCTIICVALVVVGVFVVKNYQDNLAKKNEFLAPFHDVYCEICDKYPFVTSLRQNSSSGNTYGMYYIECDIAENTDCFDEFVDIQREINVIMKARKDDEWFQNFNGSIKVYADSRSIIASYYNGSIGDIWVNDIISDNYSVLWDAFPEKEFYMVLYLTDYSDKIKTRITEQYDGRIIVKPRTKYIH